MRMKMTTTRANRMTQPIMWTSLRNIFQDAGDTIRAAREECKGVGGLARADAKLSMLIARSTQYSPTAERNPSRCLATATTTRRKLCRLARHRKNRLRLLLNRFELAGA